MKVAFEARGGLDRDPGLMRHDAEAMAVTSAGAWSRDCCRSVNLHLSGLVVTAPFESKCEKQSSSESSLAVNLVDLHAFFWCGIDTIRNNFL